MIGFKALKATVAELHGEGATPTSLLGRFKYLQRMSFPEGSNAGVGSRVDYGLSQVLALALAFELQENTASPVRVVRLLRHRWPQIEAALAATWASLERRGGEALLLAHSPGALAEMGLADDEDRQPVDPLEVLSPARVVAWLQDWRGGGAPSVYMIDLGRFLRRVGPAIISAGGVSGTALADRFFALGESAFGTADPSKWRLDAIDVAAAGEGSADRGRDRLERQD